MGQGQGDRAIKLITDGWVHGHWIILENCHLEETWLENLEKLYLVMMQSEDINEDFRLWCITKPTTSFPIAVVRNSVKFTNDMPVGTQACMIKQYTTEPLTNDKFLSCAFNGPLHNFWLKSVFSLAVFHAVVNERKRFRSIGWNCLYDFNDDDFSNCVSQLRLVIKQFGELSFDHIQNFVGASSYGGKVFDGIDQCILSSMVKIFFNANIIGQENYRFFSDAIIAVPSEPNKYNCIEYLNSLPEETVAADIGLHKNAEILTNYYEVKQVISKTRFPNKIQP